MSEIVLQPVSEADKPSFVLYFQDYLAELAAFNGIQPDSRGRFDYDQFDLYWGDSKRMPFFVRYGGQLAGLLLLRELRPADSPLGRSTLQVAEIYVFRTHRRRGIGREVMRQAARIAESRGLPLTWSAYMNNGPANALYLSVLRELTAPPGRWTGRCERGIDRSGLARFFYHLVPVPKPDSAGDH
jgi:predicted acetyltransferase